MEATKAITVELTRDELTTLCFELVDNQWLDRSKAKGADRQSCLDLAKECSDLYRKLSEIRKALP